jgi:sec-independent protein translocase protein TatA
MGLDNPLHIAFLLLVVLLVFGAKRLPELGRSLGGGMRGFRDAISGVEAHSALTAPAPVAEPAAVVAHDAVPAASAALPTTPQETPQL